VRDFPHFVQVFRTVHGRRNPFPQYTSPPIGLHKTGCTNRVAPVRSINRTENRTAYRKVIGTKIGTTRAPIREAEGVFTVGRVPLRATKKT
jgi:hypothetical protein